ncbi:carbamate kinase [Candidatus Korarchaeum cryptofilum]|jgi:carbamate kinase|uniref:Carbamate kinase n=1 Tax=Korarchaeum cryptofilum (strain OPF8) TaxID=374847 RepID=B1L6B7_KORCO|nr:carbamate kinase [Candidatus Korarchaeum cryptofilum]ACB07996.1 carbamate kinase [Candidatus Korarchaeum cryptofilum OPF8]
MSLLTIALGGNALLQYGQKGTFEEQLANARVTAKQIVEFIKRGYKVVVTHGNGPQVGAILLQQEAGSSQVPAMPLHACGAMSQGLIGYMIQQSLINELRKAGIDMPVATVVTQVLVDRNDRAFRNPTKFIGPWYSEEEAKEKDKLGWVMKYDVGKGWRRVVPSPDPIKQVEIEAIRRMVDSGIIVIASGGGGIPVVDEEELEGVDAVIDKDLAGERLASSLGAEIFMILTDVEKVAINFKKENQRFLDVLTLEEARKYYEEGHFPPGNMGPKVLAAIRFVERTGKTAIITSLDKAIDALDGKTGTRIVKK